MDIREKIIENKQVGHPEFGIYKLVLNGPIAQTAEPGQFVHIRVLDSHEPLLRRPLSIAGIDREKEEITIYYRVAGKGTELLAQLNVNSTLSVIGPLGKGFTLPQEGELLLIAGGIGVFPLYSVIEAANKTKLKVKLLWGAENKAFLESADIVYLKSMNPDLSISTLDGSAGHKGLVTALLEEYLTRSSTGKSIKAAACGPKGMLKAVTEICLHYDVELEVSLEERMACGVGACLGCVCTVRDEAGNIKRKRVCKEGPVLQGKEVIWDAEC